MASAIFNLPSNKGQVAVYYSPSSPNGLSVWRRGKIIYTIDNGLNETEVIVDELMELKVTVRLVKWLFFYRPEIVYKGKSYYGTANGSSNPIADVNAAFGIGIVMGVLATLGGLMLLFFGDVTRVGELMIIALMGLIVGVTYIGCAIAMKKGYIAGLYVFIVVILLNLLGSFLQLNIFAIAINGVALWTCTKAGPALAYIQRTNYMQKQSMPDVLDEETY